MLTSTRFADQLAAVGVLPAGALSGAFLVPVRDPGGKLEPGYAPALEAAAPADARRSTGDRSTHKDGGRATRPRARGISQLSGRRGHRCVALAAYDFGVIAEISTTEAFATLVFIDQLRSDRRPDGAYAGGRTVGGFHAVAVAAAIRTAAEAGRLYARARSERRRNGHDLSRAPRTAEAPDRDQSTEEARPTNSSTASSAKCSSPANCCTRTPWRFMTSAVRAKGSRTT